MKKVFILLLIIAPAFFIPVQSQISMNQMAGIKAYKKKLGIKAGINYSNVSSTSANLSLNGRSGFMLGGFFAPATRSGFGFRTELIYSRQGFSYNNNNSKTTVGQDYLYLPQLTTYTIGKIVQLQAGMQLGFLLNAKKENGNSQDVKSYYNHLDYGFAGGVEFNLFKFLIAGGRYNVSLGNIYSSTSSSSTTPFPFPFNPNDLKGKNSVLQFYLGCKL